MGKHKESRQEMAGKEKRVKQPTHFTVGVQTDYRESETQTDPYTPEYVTERGITQPELLQVATLTWGQGLPAGLAEVQMIERARAKRAWEASLPSADDPIQLAMRKRMMEEKEAKEWEFIREEIQNMQNRHLARLKDFVIQQNKAHQEVIQDKLNQKYAKLQKDKEVRLQRIQDGFVRSLSLLEAKRRNMDGKIEQRTQDATDSQTYACQTHIGTFIMGVYDNDLQSHYKEAYEGLLKLTAGMATKAYMKRPKPKVSNSIATKPLAKRVVQLINKYKSQWEENDDTRESSGSPAPLVVGEEPPEVEVEIDLS